MTREDTIFYSGLGLFFLVLVAVAVGLKVQERRGERHDWRCSGECGPCGGVGFAAGLGYCFHCGGDGVCHGCRARTLAGRLRSLRERLRWV